MLRHDAGGGDEGRQRYRLAQQPLLGPREFHVAPFLSP